MYAPPVHSLWPCSNQRQVFMTLHYAFPQTRDQVSMTPCHNAAARIHSAPVSQSAQSLPVQPVAEHPAPAPEGLFTRDFLLLCLSSFLFSLSMFLLFAVLPVFVVQELKGTRSDVGLVMGAFALSAVLARPISGRIVDIWNRKAGL